jgi:RNA polymerase sigma factor (sigma-70 family)
MRAATDLHAFSGFVGALHEAREDLGGAALLGWAARELSGRVGFDAAWIGWAEIAPGKVEIAGSTVFNLPDDYVSFWREISTEDLLAADVLASDRTSQPWAHYDRDGARHTDGMIALADRYGLRKLAVVTRPFCPMRPQLFLSAYRAGAQARRLSGRELAFIACALDHLQGMLDRAGADPDGALRLLVDTEGRPLAGSRAALALWAGWSTARSESFDAFMAARGFDVVAGAAPLEHGHQVSELRLVRRRLIDRFSPRERQIVELIAEGMTHKQIARRLGISPSTVRNQTAQVYRKAGVSGRAALTRAIYASPPATPAT